MNPNNGLPPKPKIFPGSRLPPRPPVPPSDGDRGSRRSRSRSSSSSKRRVAPFPATSTSDQSTYSRSASVQELNDAVNGPVYSGQAAQAQAPSRLTPAARFVSAVKAGPESSHSLGPLAAKALSAVSDQSRLDPVPSRLPPPKSTTRHLSRSPSRISSCSSPAIPAIKESSNMTSSVSQNGPATPPALFSSTAEQRLIQTLARLANLRPALDEQNATLSTSALQDLFSEGDEARASLKAWKEAEGKQAEERRASTEAACKGCAKDLMCVMREMMDEARDESVGFSARGAGARWKMEMDEQNGSKSAPFSIGSPSSPSGDHSRIVELESKIASLQSQVDAHQASRNSLEVQLRVLAGQVKADVTATFESRIVALEARGSSLGSNSITSTATSPQPSESPSHHFPPHPSNAASPSFVTQTSFDSYSTNISVSMKEIESKGKTLAARVGVEWTASESVLGKRKLAEGAEDSSKAVGGEESAERKESLMEKVEMMHKAGEDVLRRVEHLETTSEEEKRRIGSQEAALEHLTRRVEEGSELVQGVGATMDVEMRGDSSVRLPRPSSQRPDQPTTSAPAHYDADPSLSTETITMISEADSAMQEAIEVLKEELRNAEHGAEERLMQLQRGLQERDDKLEQAIYEGEERLRVLTTYFATNNRLQSLDQLLNVWPALRIALRDWKTVNQPPIVGSGGTGGVL